MNIAIIGAGTVGRALAASSVRAGHSVVISAATHDHARDAAASAAAKAAVLQLVESLGFIPIDAGPLAMARCSGGWRCSTSP